MGPITLTGYLGEGPLNKVEQFRKGIIIDMSIYAAYSDDYIRS